jgi:hypothetical protein
MSTLVIQIEEHNSIMDHDQNWGSDIQKKIVTTILDEANVHVSGYIL